ncbi:hypothetical protein [Endozoicomonas sp. Mp262]|uniref:hypothetical protein n=1 Tax=Endozoicomonas sp. Mp262 TaxID=2919499 RepID=UPI0021D85FF3
MSTTPPNVAIEMIRGDSLNIPLTFLDPADDNTRIPVNGYHLRMTVKVSSYLPDSEAVINKQITLPAETANGEYVLILAPADTNTLEPMTYDYDIQISSPDNSEVITLVTGKLKLLIGTSW